MSTGVPESGSNPGMPKSSRPVRPPPRLPGPTATRFDRLDGLRGMAMVWMVAFHFFFDLNHFGLLEPRQNFLGDPVWTLQRVAIVSLFLFCAGLGQAVALQAGQPWSRFWRRWAQVAACAVLVSLGSAWMFPNSWISFGVLHGIAVMLIICRIAMSLRAAPWLLWLAGGLVILLPLWLRHPFFDAPALQWTGLVTVKPVSEDYVPVLPWLGVMLWGLAAGQWLLKHQPAWLSGAWPQSLQGMAYLGRWPLVVYMLHQPLIMGVLMGGRSLGWW